MYITTYIHIARFQRHYYSEEILYKFAEMTINSHIVTEFWLDMLEIMHK